MYNIKAAAKMLDMPKVTIRSWETRYQAIEPERSPSGHRLYTEQNVEDLKWLKKQVHEHGVKISEAVRQLHELKRARPPLTESRSTGLLKTEHYENEIESLYQAVVQVDAERCTYLLDLYFTQFHYRVVFFAIIVPLMNKVGEQWERDTLGVAQEHMISHIVEQRFNQFFRVFPTSYTLPKVLALCPSGENHQLGLLLFTLFLRENGFPVLYLGQSTPLDGLDTIILNQDIRLVCFSISNESQKDTLHDYINHLSRTKQTLQFVVGGKGAEPDESMPNTWYLNSDYEAWLEWLETFHKHI
ncbi:MerR family transcriptional regulator [Thalassobacillus sp. CUG 92003]|uniref:MerR family transcriptional regulator n=1 Tax=Thalassobacillus sp. CUG 92003 TaxID=2736641 RepID=UPI0015E71687|nr:MerR family transcriptional regulator [Thalassobacillus sp. CUG 92003]